MWQQLIATFGADFVGLVLLVSGARKLFGLRLFAQILRGYGLIPDWTSRPLSVVVSVSEGLIGASILIPLTRSGGLIGSMIIAGAAAIVVGGSIAVGRVPEHCGCFGPRGPRPSWRTVTRLAGLVGMSGILTVVLSDQPTGPTGGPVLMATVMAAMLWRALSSLRLAEHPYVRGSHT